MSITRDGFRKALFQVAWFMMSVIALMCMVVIGGMRLSFNSALMLAPSLIALVFAICVSFLVARVGLWLFEVISDWRKLPTWKDDMERAANKAQQLTPEKRERVIRAGSMSVAITLGLAAGFLICSALVNDALFGIWLAMMAILCGLFALYFASLVRVFKRVHQATKEQPA